MPTNNTTSTINQTKSTSVKWNKPKREIIGESTERVNVAGHVEGDNTSLINTDQMTLSVQDRVAMVNDPSSEFYNTSLAAEWRKITGGYVEVDSKGVVTATGATGDASVVGVNVMAAGETQVWTTDTVKSYKTGTKTSVTSNTSNQSSLASRTSKTNLISTENLYFQRPLDVTYSMTNMKPNSPLTATFNGIDIDSFCTTLVTDSTGNCSGTFSIPESTFLTGTNELHFQDANNSVKPFTYCSYNFMSKGTTEKYQTTHTSVYDHQAITRVNTDTKTTQVASYRPRRYISDYCAYDPIAQSFFVEDRPDGIFLSSIEVFFLNKDSTVPANIRLVAMKNGYPTTTIIPFSDVALAPGSISTSSNGSVGTKFTFSDPVYLNNNTDYAFIVWSNSLNYNLWYSTIGEIDGITGKRIERQPLLGSMFKSQNASTWTAEQESDVKFKMNECVFSTGTETIPFTSDVTGWTADVDMTALLPNFETLSVSSTSTALSYKFDDDVVYTPLNNKDRWGLDSYKTITQDGTTNKLNINLDMTSSNPHVSPILAKHRANVIAEENLVFDVTNPKAGEELYKDCGTYITKPARLEDPADDLRVFVDAYLPNNARLRVFYKESSMIPKYVDATAGFTVDGSLSGKDCYVYWYDSANGDWENKGTCFVTHSDDENTPNTVSLSQITDYDNFIASGNFGTANITLLTTGVTTAGINNIFLSDHKIDETQGIIIAWSGVTNYVSGDYVYYNSKFYVAETKNTNVIPSDDGTVWTNLDMYDVEGVVQTAAENSWLPMKRIVKSFESEINVNDKYIEYEYEPEVYPEGEFTEYSVRIELQSLNSYINVPKISNFRAIAVL